MVCMPSIVHTCTASLFWASAAAMACEIVGANALNRTLNMAIQATTSR